MILTAVISYALTTRNVLSFISKIMTVDLLSNVMVVLEELLENGIIVKIKNKAIVLRTVMRL